MSTFHIATDAAIHKSSKGYRGRAGIAIINEKNELVKLKPRTLGKVTNNEGEAKAMLYGIQALIAELTTPSPAFSEDPDTHGECTEVVMYTDSQLLFHQLTGTYKVKKKSLGELHVKIKEEALKLVGDKTAFKLVWHEREAPLASLADFASKHPKDTYNMNNGYQKKGMNDVFEKVEKRKERHAEIIARAKLANTGGK